jgi:DNA-binding MarR family transcriptional regulator
MKILNEDENFYARRGQWLDYLVTRRDLTHGDFRVAYFIASKIRRAGQTMWWSVPRIAEELGVSIATVTAATDKLNNAGLLVISKGAKGSYRYGMRMPIDPVAAAFAAAPQKRKKTGGRKSRVSKTETG